MEENDAEQIQKIVMGYARQVTKTEEEANQFILNLASTVQQEGAKLVHFGNTVFLILVRAPGVVEVHTMSINESGLSLAKNLVDLAQYLKALGTKVMYTYSDDPKYKPIAARTKILKARDIKLPDGKSATAYVAEF